MKVKYRYFDVYQLLNPLYKNHPPMFLSMNNLDENADSATTC